MRVYIDESGSFIPEASPTRVCCEAALVVPESLAAGMLTEYERLRAAWTPTAEIKGSSLSDDQTAAALAILGRYDVLVEIVALDVGHNSRKQIEEFRHGQAEAFLKGLTSQHNANARAWAHGIRKNGCTCPRS